MKKVFAVLLLCVSGYVRAQGTKVDPSRINWPTGVAGCVYAPGSNTCVAAGGGITAITGDVTASGTGSVAATLATVLSTPGCQTLSGVYICFNAKGLTTALGSPFTISTFSCQSGGSVAANQNFELGYTFSSPVTCNYGYTGGTAVTASITDSNGNTGTMNGGLTVGTLTHSYTSGVTFYGNATSSSQTAPTVSNAIGFLYCSFYGLSTGSSPTGATSSGSGSGNQCASETSTLAGGLGVLGSNGLGNSQVGETFTFSSPVGSYAALFVNEPGAGCNHTSFTYNGSSPVNPVATQAVSGYSNILGGTQPFMCIYTFGPYSSSTTIRINN